MALLFNMKRLDSIASRFKLHRSTNMLHLLRTTILHPQIRLQRPPKQLQQNLKTDLRNSRIIPPLTKFIPNKSMLSPRKLVKAKHHTRIPEFLPNQVPPLIRDVRILDAEDHGHLALDLAQPVQRVVAVWWCVVRGVGGFVGAEGSAVDVGCEVVD